MSLSHSFILLNPARGGGVAHRRTIVFKLQRQDRPRPKRCTIYIVGNISLLSNKNKSILKIETILILNSLACFEVKKKDSLVN